MTDKDVLSKVNRQDCDKCHHQNIFFCNKCQPRQDSFLSIFQKSTGDVHMSIRYRFYVFTPWGSKCESTHLLLLSLLLSHGCRFFRLLRTTYNIFSSVPCNLILFLCTVVFVTCSHTSLTDTHKIFTGNDFTCRNLSVRKKT